MIIIWTACWIHKGLLKDNRNKLICEIVKTNIMKKKCKDGWKEWVMRCG